MELISVKHTTSEAEHAEVVEKMKAEGRRDLCVDFESAKVKEKDLSFLQNYTFVTELTIMSPKESSLSDLAMLPNLEGLGLSYAKLRSIEALGDLSSLNDLAIYGGKLDDYSEIGKLKNLKALSITSVRSLESIDFISDLNSLQYLSIDTCKKISKLPSFEVLDNLRYVFFENLSIVELSSLMSAKSLEKLIVMRCDDIKDDEFTAFIRHPNKPHIYPSHNRPNVLEALGESGIESFYGTEHERFEFI